MVKLITIDDLSNYINICKRCKFNQIHEMFNNIDKGILITDDSITSDEYDSLINIYHTFEKDTINIAKNIYQMYYNMKKINQS